jgi:Domain of unknown function (DUF4279)
MRTQASFRFFGDPGLPASAVTQALAIPPSHSYEVGDPISPRTTKLRDSSLWLLNSSDQIETGVELETQLERLMEILEPLTVRLHGLVDLGYHANWFCYVESGAAEHAVKLPRPLLQRLMDLPGDLWLDVA